MGGWEEWRESDSEGHKGKGNCGQQGPDVPQKAATETFCPRALSMVFKSNYVRGFLLQNCHSLSRDKKTDYRNTHPTDKIEMEPKCHDTL